MEVPFLTSPNLEVSFKAESSVCPQPTPKGYLRVKSLFKSSDTAGKSCFLVDLSKVSKGNPVTPLRSKLYTSHTLRNSSTLRPVNKSSVQDPQQKYDLSKSVYDRQQEWRLKA
jgi:hypothetical protein